MPRFGISSMGLSSPEPLSSPTPLTSPPFSSPQTGMSALVPFAAASNNQPSVRLCCASGDGRAIFSLQFQRSDGYWLQRRTLPLHDDANEPKNPQQTRLPQFVQTALDLCAPVELLYVEGDEPKPSNRASQQDDSFPPTLLCLYSRKNVFYLEMTMDANGEVVVEATVAYDNYFVNADDTLSVVRIRAAPQRRETFATFCPRGAMAMLTHNPYSKEYALVLQHNHDYDVVSVPLNFVLEESSEMGLAITDFCFALSDGLALLSSMTVLLLKGSGEVYAASPIVFDGSVIHKSALAEAVDFLEYQIGASEINRVDPKWKQCRAANQFLKDAFGESADFGGSFLTASIISHARIHSAVSWPVKIQGPILSPDEPGVGCYASIENFSSSDLIGLAVGGEGHVVNLSIVSPSCLLPRFMFESAEDGIAIDEKLIKCGAAVQRLLLSEEDPTGIPVNNQALALIRDPLMDSMLHYVTSKGVTTINTTAMRHSFRKLLGQAVAGDDKKGAPVRNSAWSSVHLSSGAVEGAVVGTDPRFGHGLFVKISGGSVVPVNVTESRYLHDMDHLINPDADQSEHKVPPSPSIAAAGLQKMKDIPPFYETIDPLLKKVLAGLAGMGKIVGSETWSTDVNPEHLAVALAVKERCDNEVVLPLFELRRSVLARRELIKTIFKDQRQQISELKSGLSAMQERMLGLQEKASAAQENAGSLAKRGTSVLQASQDLQPSMTQAECAFFDYLRRQKVNLEKVERNCKQAIDQTTEAEGKIKKGDIACSFKMDDTMVKHADQLLDGQEKLMADIEVRLKASEQLTQQIAQETGVAGLSFL